MSTIHYTVKPGDKPSKEQIEEINEASKQPITFDEDSPHYTLEELREMAEYTRKMKAELKKPVVSLRITPDTLEKAKATGRGYTGFLSRLLDLAINDPEMVRKSLEQM